MSNHDTPNTDTMRAYFESWRDSDFERFASLLDPDVDFAGPFGTAQGAEECLKGIRGMAEMATDIRVLHMAEDGDHVITWFELHTADAVLAVANLSQLRDGKVVRVRAAFDPRPLLEG